MCIPDRHVMANKTQLPTKKKRNQNPEKKRALSQAQRKYNLFRSVGRAISRIREESLELKQSPQYHAPQYIPVYVLEHESPTAVKLAINYPKRMQIDAFASVVDEFQQLDEDQVPYENRPTFQHYPNTYLVGYDVEFQQYEDELHPDYPAKLLSHQFYFNFAGHRFGVIMITDVTFRSVDLVRLINTCVPINERMWRPPGARYVEPELSLVRIYAHFSAVESGWMQPSMQKTSEFKDFFGFIRSEFQPLVGEREKEWCNTSQLRTVKPVNPKTRKSAKKDQWPVRLMYCDSKNLSGGGSLEDLGTKIGIPKVKHDFIEKMEEYRRDHFDMFCYYGMMDSIITAETHLWYNNVGRYQLGLQVEKERAAGLSTELFKALFEEIHGEHWKRYLGYDEQGKMTVAHRAFVQFYHGGRNEVLTVGPRGKAVYYDLRSAYPTSLIMLPDYDFRCSKTYHGQDAVRAVERLEKDDDGPFQVAGIVVSFKFHENVPPVFPVRIDEPSNLPNAKRGYDTDGLIFPRSGHTTVTWPELWVARNTVTRDGKHTNLLEELTIHSLTTFKNLGTKEFSKKVYDVLAKRDKKNKPMDSYYKQILNYFYGKTGQAIADAATSFKDHDLQKPMPISAVTSYPIAAFITGFCRAAVANLLQRWDCYGITTDGFISPEPDGTFTKDPGPDEDNPIRYSSEELNLGKDSFCGRVHDRVKALNPFIGIDSEGDASLFLKTRGYLLVTDGIQQKLARVGAQTKRVRKKIDSKNPTQTEIDEFNKEHSEAVEEFLKITLRGRCDKVSWRSLPNQRKYWRAELDELYDKDEVLTRAKAVLTSTTVRVMHTDKGLVPYKQAEQLHGRLMANRQLKHTKDTLPLQVTFKDAKVNVSFDMKRIPKNPIVDSFMWEGEPYKYVSFETDPLNSITDFHLLRSLAKRSVSHKSFIEAIATRTVTGKTPYDQLEKIRTMQFPALTEDELMEVEKHFPEVAKVFKQKTTKRLATNDAFTIAVAYDAYVEKIEKTRKSRIKNGLPTDDLDSSPAAFQDFIREEIKRKKDKASDRSPFRPEPEPGDFEKPLKKTVFDGDYQERIENYLASDAEFRKKISAACEVFKKPKKTKPLKLDLSFEREELISFMSKHGGGWQKRAGAKKGFVDEEPVRMELEDYLEMLEEFKKVSEYDFAVTPIEADTFYEGASDYPLARSREEKRILKVFLTKCREQQVRQELEIERKSLTPVSIMSEKELTKNAQMIVDELYDQDVMDYIQEFGINKLSMLLEFTKTGVTISKAVQLSRLGITSTEAAEMVAKTAEKTRRKL